MNIHIGKGRFVGLRIFDVHLEDTLGRLHGTKLRFRL